MKIKIELGPGRFDQFLERRIEIAAQRKQIIKKHVRASIHELRDLKRSISITEEELVPFKSEEPSNG